MSPKRLINRRNFIKATAAGASGFFFLASNAKGEGKKESSRKFIYRILGKTGIKLPVISMGVTNTNNPNLVRAALDSGIVMLDTAQIYQRGQNEGMIGKVLRGRPRGSYVLATKERLPSNPMTGLYTEEATEEAFLKKVDLSLENLGLEYVDILYHHDVAQRERALFEPILKAMEKAKKAGKARFLGISTHRNEPEVIQAAIDSKIYEVILTACNFKQKHYAEVRGAIAKAAKTGIGVIAMKVMGGTLSQDPLIPFNAGAALKWVLQDPNVHTTVPGFTTFEEMNVDLSVMEDLSLTDSEKEYLRKEASIAGLYCQGCGQCVKRCIAKLPIPDLMRAYMYTYGYRKPSIAQELVLSLGLPRHVCEDCGQCPVKCSIGFNVSSKIRDVVRLRDVPQEFIA